MVAYAAAEGYECPGCWEVACCCDEREAQALADWDPELDSLEETPEGQEWTPDQRDTTRRPPAYLNPRWILRMRRRLETYRKTGRVDWMQPHNALQGDNHASHP